MQRIGAPQGGDGYFRIDDRPAPHNYLAELSILRERIEDTASADVANIRGWKIAKQSPDTGLAVQEVAVRWPSEKKTYYWDGQQWLMSATGQPVLTQLELNGSTERAQATNILVMEAPLQPSPFSDKFGAATPYALRAAFVSKSVLANSLGSTDGSLKSKEAAGLCNTGSS